MSLRGHGRVLAVRATVAVAAATLVLAGCQANPAPPPLESTAESTSPSPSPSPTPPSMPAEAKGTSKAAAKAFVRHYIDLVNYAMATGDIAPISAVSDPSCDSCDAVIQRIDSVYNKGGSISSDGWRIRSIQIVPMQPPRKPQVDLGLQLSPQRVVPHKAAAPREFDGGRLPVTLGLQRHGSTWTVASWERAA